MDREVPLVKPRAAADAALRADIEVTELGILKVVGVEPKAAVGLGVELLKRCYLLRRFGQDAWVVVAAWDLTAVERAVMSQSLSS